jgi:hypothetical protein
VNAAYCTIKYFILRTRVIAVEVELIGETRNAADETTNPNPSEQVPEPRYYDIYGHKATMFDCLQSSPTILVWTS